MDSRARAAHHLHPGVLATRRLPAAGAMLRHWRRGVYVVAAHYAPFDQSFLAIAARSAGIDLPCFICTYRVALHLWPAAPSHSLQALRYHLGLAVVTPPGLVAHRALYDAVVAAALLRREIEQVQGDIDELIYLSTTPVLQTTVRFGENRGKNWTDMPKGYLRWMQRTLDRDPEAFDMDARYTALQELERRGMA